MGEQPGQRGLGQVEVEKQRARAMHTVYTGFEPLLRETFKDRHVVYGHGHIAIRTA